MLARRGVVPCAQLVAAASQTIAALAPFCRIPENLGKLLASIVLLSCKTHRVSRFVFLERALTSFRLLLVDEVREASLILPSC